MTAFRTPWDTDAEPAPSAGPVAAAALAVQPQPKPRGRRPAAASLNAPAPSWLYHHLVVAGLANTVEAFRAAARGSGIVPWVQDGRAVEEWVFERAVSQPPRLRSLTVEGCLVLARQFRERFEAHHARAAGQVGCSQACPLDLHALLPVPDALLRLGADHPTALAWMAEHWGVADGLRHAAVRPDLGPGRRLPRGHSAACYGFFTGGDTPRAAVAQLGARWPGLRFVLRPRPG